MYVQNNFNNIPMTGKPKGTNCWKNFNKRIKQKMLDVIPSSTLKDTRKRVERWEKIDGMISRPAENRLIMGATALVTQPAIDYYNHKVDEETRRVSRNRTIAKILAGTGVGILVRGTCYGIISKMTNLNGKSKFSKALIPKHYIDKLAADPKLLKNYRNTFSMGIALLAMCVTNFVLDAPITVYLTNKLNAKNEKEVKNG